MLHRLSWSVSELISFTTPLYTSFVTPSNIALTQTVDEKAEYFILPMIGEGKLAPPDEPGLSSGSMPADL